MSYLIVGRNQSLDCGAYLAAIGYTTNKGINTTASACLKVTNESNNILFYIISKCKHRQTYFKVVWPDWAIFKSSCWQIIFKIGLLFIPVSGHTASRFYFISNRSTVLNLFWQFVVISKNVFYNPLKEERIRKTKILHL